MLIVPFCLFFFKQKTAYEMRISDWSSDVCSSDLLSSLQTGAADCPEQTSPLGPRNAHAAQHVRRSGFVGRFIDGSPAQSIPSGSKEHQLACDAATRAGFGVNDQLGLVAARHFGPDQIGRAHV